MCPAVHWVLPNVWEVASALPTARAGPSVKPTADGWTGSGFWPPSPGSPRLPNCRSPPTSNASPTTPTGCAARAAADAAGVPFYLNARIDTHRLLPGQAAFEETVRRAHAYAAAGAVGVSVLSPLDAAGVCALADAVPVPLNVLIGPGTLTVAEYAAGAARVSAGPSIAEAAYALAERAAQELLGPGNAGVLGWAGLNAVLLGARRAV